MSPGTRTTAAAALAVALSASALVPVFDGAGWIGWSLSAVLLVSGVGLLARRAGVPRPLQPLLGAGALLAYVVLVFSDGSLHHLVLPGRETVQVLRTVVEQAGDDLASYAPPAPTTPGLLLLAVLGVGAVTVLVDTLAVAYGRAAAAGLPLLLLVAVPSGLLPGGIGWWPFVLGAAGWLGMLHVEGSERIGRWGAPLGGPGRRSGEDPAGLGRVGRRIGVTALGVAVVVPAVLPGLDARLFPGSGQGDGPGGNRRVETYNPITRLSGQLNQGRERTVLTYNTTDPSPDYLRMTALVEYDGSGWRQGELTASPGEDDVQQSIPAPVGSAGAPSRSFTTAIRLTGRLDAFWLPAPATPTQVQVEGPWLWDDATQSVFATRERTRGVEAYTVLSDRVTPSADALDAAGDDVPEQIEPYDEDVDVTDPVRQLTEQIVEGQTSDYGRAVAIQEYFREPAADRDPDRDFRYDEQTQDGASRDELQDFLDNKVGYCQQYASAMAAMLRVAGVPSRVAVGYTSGERQSDGSYVVTTEAAHAWPEAWFPSAGWVRFEPTPPNTPGRREPSYGRLTGPQPSASASAAPTASAGPSAVAGESPGERARRLAAQSRLRDAEAGQQAVGEQAAGVPWRGLGVGALVLALLAGPAGLHALRRRLRWRTPGPSAAWAQVRDDATDHGHRWDGAASPRRAAARLEADRGLPAPAAAALGRLTDVVERDRYAPPRPGSVDQQALGGDVVTLRRALRAGSSRSTRVRAVVLPPSTLRWVVATTGERVTDLLAAVDAGSTAVRRALERRLGRVRAR